MYRIRPQLSIDTFGTFGNGSVYFHMLVDHPLSCILGTFTIIFWVLLAIFFGIKANNLTTKGSDWLYTWACLPTTDDCISNDDVDTLGMADVLDNNSFQPTF